MSFQHPNTRPTQDGTNPWGPRKSLARIMAPSLDGGSSYYQRTTVTEPKNDFSKMDGETKAVLIGGVAAIIGVISLFMGGYVMSARMTTEQEQTAQVCINKGYSWVQNTVGDYVCITPGTDAR